MGLLKRTLTNKSVVRLFREEEDGTTSCFVAQKTGQTTSKRALTNGLKAMLTYSPTRRATLRKPLLPKRFGIVGPRLTVETPFSSIATAIAHNIGLLEVERVERFRIMSLPEGIDPAVALKGRYDPIREAIYDELLPQLQADFEVEPVVVIPLLEEGKPALERFVSEHNLGFKPFQVDLIEQIFRSLGQNPTDVALYYLSQQWSDHCWHILFSLTDFIIDGQPLDRTLIEMLVSPLEELQRSGNHNITIAMHDDASAVVGCRVTALVPEHPGSPSRMVPVVVEFHITIQAETHCYPSQIEAFAGTQTELGGGIRDSLAIGQGGDILVAWAIRILGGINFPSGYRIPGEFTYERHYGYPAGKETPYDVAIKGTRGWTSYANCFGKPCGGVIIYSGPVRRLRRVDGKVVLEWIESLKPFCGSAGVGLVRQEYLVKGSPEKGMLIVQIGGPAYRIGKCGGSGSSSIAGQNTAQFDTNAVQRGNPLVEMGLRRVILACLQMGEDCPIVANHDQGAGGISTCLTELMGKAGGKLFLGAVNLGDPSMSDVEVFICEYQERQGFVVMPNKLYILQQICDREKISLEVLGVITGDGMIRVYSEAGQAEVDATHASPVVELPAERVLGKYGRYKIEDNTVEVVRLPIEVPRDYVPSREVFTHLFKQLLRRSEVGPPEWFLRCVDQTVGGRTVVSPSCGLFATPVNCYSLMAMTPSSNAGIASSIGVAPYLTALDPEAGARFSIGRAITRLMGVAIKYEDIEFICNWGWAANITPPDGEIANLTRAAKAVEKILLKMAKAIIGGKDTSSSATIVEELKGKIRKWLLVKSLPVVAFSTAVPVADVRKHLTADLKHPGSSQLFLIDVARGRRRLGGSSFGQSLGQLGDFGPDLDDVTYLKQCFLAVQELVARGLVSAGLDIGPGGLAATILKMCVAGNCGAEIWTLTQGEICNEFFGEELGYVVEVPYDKLDAAREVLRSNEIEFEHLGLGSTGGDELIIHHGPKVVLREDIQTLRREWERTGLEFRRGLVKPEAANREWRNTRRRSRPQYRLTFNPDEPSTVFVGAPKPVAAVPRDTGTNGDEELVDALIRAGFDVWDLHMSDLQSGRVTTLNQFQLLAIPGGFSEGDVLGAAVAWSLKIERDPRVKQIIDDYNARDNTLVVGICNGAQLGLRCCWAPFPRLAKKKRPLFTLGPLGAFNHQIVAVRIEKSPAVMLEGMEGSILPVPVANGEGYFNCDHAPEVKERVIRENLVALSYVDPRGRQTDALPHSPSGCFVAGVCDPTGRRLLMMPHGLDRYNQLSRWVHVPPEWAHLKVSPWQRMADNAFRWCQRHA